MITFTIPGTLTDLNTYINAERANKFEAARIKKQDTTIAFYYARNLKPIKERVRVIFTWYCENEKKDPDNICFAKKFLLDGLKNAGIIGNDGWKNIAGFQDEFEVDKHNPRIEIQLVEVA